MKSGKLTFGLGDTVESKYNVLDLGQQFDFNAEKEKQDKMKQKENVRQHSSYSGGFRMLEVPKGTAKSIKKEEKATEDQKPKAFDYGSYFPKREEVFAKLGIDMPKEGNENQDEDDEDQRSENDKKKQQGIGYVDYEVKYGVKKDQFFSAGEGQVQGKLRGKLVGEIEEQVEKLHKKRDLLDKRKEALIIAEKKKQLHLSRQDDETLTEEQKIALYKNADKGIDELIEGAWKKKSPEIGQVEGVIERLRERKKELEKMYFESKKDPSKSKKSNQMQVWNQYENQIEGQDGEPVYLEEEVVEQMVKGRLTMDEDTQKSMRTLNQKLAGVALYQQRDLAPVKEITGRFDGDMYDFEYLRDVPNKSSKKYKDKGDEYENQEEEQTEIKVQSFKGKNNNYDGYHKDDYQSSLLKRKNDYELPEKNEKKREQGQVITKKNKGFESDLEIKKAETLENEKERKLRILREEMANVENLMEERGGARKKVLIEPSEKAIANVTHIPIEKKIFEQRFQEYEIDKQIKEQSDAYFRSKSRPDFERVKSSKSYEKYKQLHPEQQLECGINERAIATKKSFAEIEKEEDDAKINLYAEELSSKQRSADEKRMQDLYKRIVSAKEESEVNKRKKDDEFVLQFLFSQIDSAKSGVISVTELYEQISKNKDAITYFKLQPKTLFADSQNYPTLRKGLFSYSEFSQFLGKQQQISLKTLQSDKDKQQAGASLKHNTDALADKEELLYKQNQGVNTDGTCTLNEVQIDAFRSIFADVDVHCDSIVSRSQLLQAINGDHRIMKIMQYPAVKIPTVNRTATIQQILQQIQKEYELASDSQKQSLEYISWNQFFAYFKSYKAPSFLLDDELQNSEEGKIFEIQNGHLSLIQDIFDMVPRVPNTNDFVATADFVIAAKKDPQIRSISESQSRSKSEETGLQAETISETLNRVLEEGSDYLQWQELKMFFSKRGRPINWSITGHEEVDQKKEEGRDIKKNPLIQEIKKIEESKTIIKQSLLNQKIQQNYLSSQNSNKFQTYASNNAEQRMIGEYDSDREQSPEQNYDSDDLDGSSENRDNKFSQLRKLDVLRMGGEDIKRVKNPGEEVNEFYTKKRVIKNEITDEDGELKEEIGEFDKHYKTLIQRQKDAELGPFQSLEEKERLEDPVKYGLLKNTAVDYDKYFGQLLKHKTVEQQNKPDLTIPKPFKFDDRENNKELTIYQQKKMQYLKEVAQRDELEMKKKVKANPIPTTTKVPMFQSIMEKNKEKRDKVREESARMTLANQQPFSFYEKDLQKKEEKKQALLEVMSNTSKQVKTFKAKEVPASSKMEMMKQLEQEKEEARKKRIEERKEEQLKSVKEFTRLAGASEQWKEVLKKRETSKTWEEEKQSLDNNSGIFKCTFAPKVNTTVPETSKKTEKVVASAATKMKAVNAFAGLLGNKTTTEVEPFEFKEHPVKQADRGQMDTYNQQTKEDKLKGSNVLARLVKQKPKVEEVQKQEKINEEEQEQKEEENQDNENQDNKDNENEKDNTLNVSKKELAENKVQKGTKGQELLQKKREEDKKKKEEEANRIKKEDEERKKRLQDRAGELKDKFGTKTAKQVQEEMEEQKRKERQQQAREEKKEYENKIKEMNDRVKQKQTLTEEKLHGSKALAKYRQMQANNPVKQSNSQQEDEQANEIDKENQNQSNNKQDQLLDLNLSDIKRKDQNDIGLSEEDVKNKKKVKQIKEDNKEEEVEEEDYGKNDEFDQISD